MLKIEKKTIDFIEKHMLLLAALLISVLALLIRRQNIWYYTTDYLSYFDMHHNNVQSVFYYFLIALTGYFAQIPLHGMKWIASIADFAVGIMCVLICKRGGNEAAKPKESDKWKYLLLYAGCLFAPVVYVRGCVWAQVESLAMTFLLVAFYFAEYHRNVILEVLAAAVGVALYPFYLVPIIFYFLSTKRKEERGWLLLIILAVVLFLNVVSCYFVGVNWREGVQTLSRWMSYHPYTGEVYTTVKEWLWQMMLYGGYIIALWSGLSAIRRKIPYYIAVLTQVMVFIVYGIALGW